MMFVQAFRSPAYCIPSPNHVNYLNALSPLPTHRTPDRTSSLFATTTTSEVTPSPTNAIAIVFNEESQRHIVTVPKFLPPDDQDNDDTYPSVLHRIHIVPLLTDEETSDLLQLARTYATENQSWDQQDSSRHVSYQTVDFAIEESIEISQYLGQNGINFEERIFSALSEAYDVDEEDLSFLDLFCASYEVKETDDATTSESDEGRNTMDRLAAHRDGSLLSFTVLLSPLGEFEGGGTVFDALGDVEVDDDDSSILQAPGIIQPPQAGYATLHSGKLLHGGHVVTKGQRIVLVGFVDVHERNIKPGVLGNATKEWGRNDVRTFWNQRRLSFSKRQHQCDSEGKIDEEQQPLWKLNNWRYLSKDTAERRLISNEGRSYFGKNSVIPNSTLKRIEGRASLDKIRRRRLITEDRLLRDILLPREERGDKVEEDEEGEWLEFDPDNMDGLLLGWDGGEESDV
mmetsp:Transcript_4714/g.9251  ORF Transcript_4714/g.9251 Transcript_4714/m.9251 type:complete len:457 (-) Transcript_4714:71-1441(-)|eukprot:CAMPEP_0196142616 /NCGR_PEP_ID=MMETSP0910-20130528/11925_1 /TAXON_ID=49265 /ORGANISM="Thalassiosira rotula, Strain GSO102" /LENGTH=456 /DNA_ID=CAMNT_0041403955 /DNA_START=79 /DNA_END=1449 /DNA_ORIENTATION=-